MEMDRWREEGAAADGSGSSSRASAEPAAAAPSAGDSGAASPNAARRGGGPAAWLRHAILRNQAVAEDRPAVDVRGEYGDEAEDDASDDGASSREPADCASFGSLPEHLLEKIFGHLRGSNRKHHFAICGVNRQWRRLGQAMFFRRPWEVAHLICHPTQLFCLSPRNVTGSRSGLLKCFVRREHGPGGKRFIFHIGKDASQPQRSRFLMAAKHGGRDTVNIYMNSRCAGPPCARLRCNLFATQYKLTLADDLHLEPTSSQGSESNAAAVGTPGGRAEYRRLISWSPEAAAEAAAAAQHLQQQRVQQLERQSGGPGGGAQARQQLPVDCYAELQYQARVKGFMQPRRMRVVLPHPSQLFYDQVLPQLSRRPSEAPQLPPSATPPSSGSPASGGSSGGLGVRRSLGSRSSSIASAAAAAAAVAAASPPASPESSPQHAPAAGAAGEVVAVADAATQPASRGGRLRRWVQRLRQRRQLSSLLLRQHKTVPVGVEGASQTVVLQNKAPHWNEGLRCWCLNFRGRVKLASVKNFQLVRADDPAERVVMQFGKAEQDAFILDFNPTVLTAFQAFGVVLSTFDSKVFL